jgi:hypothetical protein
MPGYETFCFGVTYSFMKVKEGQEEGESHMKGNCGKEVAIEDLGNHSLEAVRGLRACLAAQPKLMRDPKRKNLFELQGCSSIYYIHVSPVSGKVSLLATWPSEPAVGDSHRAA